VFRKGSRGAKAQEMLERYEDSGKSTAALPDMGNLLIQILGAETNLFLLIFIAERMGRTILKP